MTTEDRLLGGLVSLTQPEEGLRAAIDAVFLAAATPAGPGERVLDVGAGTGAAALCLAARVEGTAIDALEKDPDLARLGVRNAAANGFAARLRVFAGDLLDPPPGLEAGRYDHVMTNPPYLPADRADPSPQPRRAGAAVEGEAGLEAWLRFCLAMLRPRGRLTLIHRADRLDEVLSCLRGRAGGIVLFPLWPRPPGEEGGKPAKRLLFRAVKGSRAPLRLAPGLVLHGPDGAFTDAAEAILRRGCSLGIEE